MSKRYWLTLMTAAVALSAGAASAEPDITGVWSLAQPPGVRQGGGHPPYTPAVAARLAAIAKMNADSNRLVADDHSRCLPTGMPGLMGPPFGIEFLQTKGRVTILSEVSNLPRTIYLRDKHPESLQPSWNGDSIGHWDGDTLVVDTVGFNGRLTRTSAQARISERIHLIEDGYLLDEMTVVDPVTYTEPFKTSFRYKRAEGDAADLMEYVCEVDTANLVALEAEEKAAGLLPDPSSWAVNYIPPPQTASAK